MVTQQPPVTQADLIWLRSICTEFLRVRVAMKEQGRMLVTVQAQLKQAVAEITSLKQKATPEPKCACVDDAVQKAVQLQQEQRQAGQKSAAKNIVIHNSTWEITQLGRQLAPCWTAHCTGGSKGEAQELPSPWRSVWPCHTAASTWTIPY
jgi:hypothetical protein